MIRRLTPLALALALPAAAQAPKLIVWPYVGNVTPTSATLTWATDAAGTSELRYGLDATLGQAATAATQTLDWRYFHAATLTGLQPDTTYTYRVYTAGQDLSPATLTFRTAPATTATRFTFGVMGDGRGGGSGAAAVASRMASEPFELVVHTGDFIVDTGCGGASAPSTTSTVADFMSQFFTIHKAWLLRTPFFGVMGNHEMGSCGPEFFTQMFANPGNERYYSFDWANAHFVGVDVTQAYGAGSAQLAWLENDLKTSTKPWKFVFFHYPAYSSGSHGSDATVQSALVPLFEKYGVDLVFNGHDHTYERTHPILSGATSTDAAKAITYVVSGGAGAPLYTSAGAWFTAAAASKYHYMKLEVLDDCRLTATAIDGAGAVFDTFTLDRGGCADPSVPTGLRATAGDAAVDLAWNANPEPVSGYNVKRSAAAGDPNPPVLANLVSGTAYKDTAVSNGSTYYYALSAVSGSGQESANSAAVSATPNASAPAITAQPAAQTVTAGQTATFAVTATGSSPLAYQWRKNGASLSGATASSYTTPATTTADSGSAFDVVVGNAVGSATSTAAILTVNPAPSGSELIQNGGFESGTAPWTASSAVRIGTFSAEPAYEGARCAWMGGKGASNTQALYQTVTIPSTAAKVTLTFALHIDTTETTTSKAYDTLKAYLVKATSGSILKSLGTFSNLNKAPGYQQVSYDVSAFKGQTLRVYFQAKENASGQTSFVLDKVSLLAQ